MGSDGVDAPEVSGRSIWRSLAVLVAATLATQLASLAWNVTQYFWSIVLSSTAVIVVLTTPLAFLGLRLGPALGLGAPLLDDLLSRRPGALKKLALDARLATALGLGIGVFLLALRVVLAPFLPPELTELGYRGVVGSLLVAAGAAVTEEVWLRLGAMTILAWLFSRLSKPPGLGPVSAWAAIIAAAALFGAVHLPQLAASGANNLVGVAGTMLGNMLVGIACGWLYWRRSLMAAILAHFAIDLVLHVLPVAIGLQT